MSLVCANFPPLLSLFTPDKIFRLSSLSLTQHQEDPPSAIHAFGNVFDRSGDARGRRWGGEFG